MTRIQTALDQMAFARRYTVGLIDTIPVDQWFVMPQPGTTHVAWQVGHLAMAQYRVCIERWRGIRPEDERLISTHFLNLFLRDSDPNADAATYPPAAEIREVFDRVSDFTMATVAAYDEAEFDLPMHAPHKYCKTRGECLFWASAHEMLHAGQIGLLRRLLGHKPVW
ncbi:DinB family protein [Limnoglobus roseus]|uniref:DinB family protein n=1 Tax=Limnoglobus roseus TaxID=2598579 RepID=A0A5C1A9U4_9BACT|nr:DinB family protein [Limnoglobus roseus]QEL13894.1 DinB family protein [Limnoglobus roseus]